MARLGFLLKASLVSHICTTLALAQLLSSNHFPQNGTTTTWKNNGSLPETNLFSDGSLARFILLQVINSTGTGTGHGKALDPLYGFGLCFYCQFSNTDSCYLSIVFVEMNRGPVSLAPPPLVVWSANRDRPIGQNSVLCMEGDLVLKDQNGNFIWSTGAASNSSAIGISLTSLGNLVLLDRTNRTIWQSFDHPTDTLLLGQRLRKGQRVISSMSSDDTGSGLFYLSVDSDTLSAYVAEQNNSLYLTVFPFVLEGEFWGGLEQIEFGNGNITFFYYKGKGELLQWLETPISLYLQLLRLDPDGGLRIYSWDPESGWLVIRFFSGELGECQYPLKCGRYGVCQNGQCSCPVALDGIHFFQPFNPHFGCQFINASSSDDRYELRRFGHLSYFTYHDLNAATPGLESEESCKEACLRDGESCMAAFFLHGLRGLRGYCYLVSHVLSILGTAPLLNGFSQISSSYIKVPLKVKVSSTEQGHSTSTSMTLPVALALVLLFVLLGFVLLRRRRIHRERLYLKRLSETMARFSYKDLSTATQNFSQNVGGGGFGLVFKGTLPDGREVAVKRLGNDGQGKKEFLAEVETVGKVHHFNLVSLIGFCVENKHMIIVYEYLVNGSLDKWIFNENQNTGLDWEPRKKIVLGVAKGLTYIHEECKQRIAHLDVKPHNILVDDNFNAKVSDFGMSKLIGRDESQVMTGMRGTLGYLAPEWQGSSITVKADVYSFGILVLEVVSGRKVLDYSRPESDVHLLKLLKKKSLENRLRDIVDRRCEDMVSNSGDVVYMIRLAMWCLQSDYKRRPAMSLVVKVLEGSLEVEPNITHNFSSIFSPA